jgi:hypothetical protein
MKQKITKLSFLRMIRVFIMQDTISKEFMTMFLTSTPRCYVSSTYMKSGVSTR